MNALLIFLIAASIAAMAVIAVLLYRQFDNMSREETRSLHRDPAHQPTERKKPS